MKGKQSTIAEKLIIISIIIVMLFNFIMPNRVYAAGFIDSSAGIIIEPLVVFVNLLVDSVMSLLSYCMTGENISFVMKDTPMNEENVGTEITIDDLQPYRNAIGNLNIKYPHFNYSPEEIFSGEIEILNANFISETTTDESLGKIREVVSAWYRALRILALIGLLSILIYTGIKIIISASASDKAKYKERIINWFMAVALLFVMHYIMAFMVIVIQEIMKLLGDLNGVIKITLSDGKEFTTNLIGWARFQLQQQEFSAKITYLMIYIALVVFTFKFTFLYLKRTLKMAFLTLIAPLVALMYPIEKMDGKAKGFSLWLKEYLYNLLLQPMHYILYYILISSSLTLAAKSPLYAIAAIMFMSEGEKLLKKIFGFDRARGGTVGGIAGAYAAGSLASALTNTLSKAAGGGSSSGKGTSGKSSKKGNYSSDDEEDIPEDIINDTGLESFMLDGNPNNEGNDYLDETVQNDEDSQTVTDEGSQTVTDEGGQTVTDESSAEEINDGSSEKTELDVDQTMIDFRNMFAQMPEDIREKMLSFDFNDGDSRTLEEILKHIMANQSILSGMSDDDPNRDAIENDIFKDVSLLGNRISANEDLFTSNGVPLQYIDGDKRSNKQINDDLLKNMGMLNTMSYDDWKKQGYEQKVNNDMNLLKNRMAENNFIADTVNSYKARIEAEKEKNKDSNNMETENEKGKDTNNTKTEDEKNKGNSGRKSTDKKQEKEKAKTTSENKKAIRKPSNLERTLRGAGSVGKYIARPVVDFDKSVGYNAGRIGKKALAIGVGITAATVQAGISITDGKYKPVEGVGAFAAGAYGANKLVDRFTTSDKARKNENIEQYSNRWYNRDDTIQNFKDEYGAEAKDMRKRAKESYVMRGIVDFEEQKQAIKFANQLMSEGKRQEDADRLAVATLQYKKTLIKDKNYAILHDAKRMEKYLNVVSEEKDKKGSNQALRSKHMEFIENVIRFEEINS